jgi:hypothetical protein
MDLKKEKSIKKEEIRTSTCGLIQGLDLNPSGEKTVMGIESSDRFWGGVLMLKVISFVRYMMENNSF